ncbi:MAG: ABC transporter ATP-binding protein [Planctomycetota bacterium]
MSAPRLELRAVRHSYREADNERSILRGVDLEVRAGETVALVGRSGSGKSTLLHLTAGIEPIESGSVRLDGRELDSMDDHDRTVHRRRHIGLVFQSFHLLPLLTVIENVLLPVELEGRVDAEGLERARALLTTVGLGDRADTHPDRLSGGERQRVALARALIRRPAVLLADEPTGNLDATNADQVLDLILDLARRENTATLLATHSREIASRCDRVVELQDGQLVSNQPA